ncbi:MAG: two-component system, cell cycle response regulator [Actinomycetota bacterium]|nr:two-component system, cell cycle response regulator [Actinomycetota bacterium]
MIDGTTQLSGVAAFEKRLDMQLRRCAETRSPLSLMLVDIDGMERINHALGTDAGDRVLMDVARALRATTRAPNELFRYRSDEFVMILPGTDTPGACIAAERCRSVIADSSGRPRVTVSIGVAEVAPGHVAQDVVSKAKLALSRAQESGGDRAWRGDDPRRHGINPQALSEELTDREWAIVGHLVRRRTEQDIAERMGIKAGTVRSHKARIRRKLHVQPESRLTDFATQHFSDVVEQRERSAPDDLRLVIDLRD